MINIDIFDYIILSLPMDLNFSEMVGKNLQHLSAIQMAVYVLLVKYHAKSLH